jgi:hypothetical protein
MTRGAYVFVAFVYLVLGASFLASTATMMREFYGYEWLTMLLTHSHLFLFFPLFGLLVLAAFYLPSVAFAHMYWYHVPYGRLRFIFGIFVAVGLSLGVSHLLTSAHPRGIWEIAPNAIRADRGVPANCRANNVPCERAPIGDVLGVLRTESPSRLGLSEFARSCTRDKLLPATAIFKEERYCFPAMRMLSGDACCTAQRRFKDDVGALSANPRTRSQAADLDIIFMPFKVFFIVVMIVVALMLAVWRNKMDTHYKSKVPSIERGIMIGAIAMLFWPIMDYGYQQTADVLFGREYGAFKWRWSVVIGPWVVLLLFFFLRRLGKNMAMVGQFSGIAGGLFAVLRYQDINNWAQRFFGAGADDWMPFVFGVLAFMGVAALLWRQRSRAAQEVAGSPDDPPAPDSTQPAAS